MDIFEFAMQKEKYSEDYYRKLADQTTDAGLGKILNMLADEEVKHYSIVKQMKSKTPVDMRSTDILSEAKVVFEKMRESVEKFDLDIEQTELYKKAQNIEKESRDFYLEKASEAAEEAQKKIFLKLAEEEKKHYFLLDNIIEFVDRPTQWLENAEFYHLEEY